MLVLLKYHFLSIIKTAKIIKMKNDNPRMIGLSPLAMKCLKELSTTINGTFFPSKEEFTYHNDNRFINLYRELRFKAL